MKDTKMVAAGPLALAAAAFLVACAGPAVSRYEQEYAKLEQDCAARGGILTPAPRTHTGRAASDNYCEIRGAPLRAGR